MQRLEGGGLSSAEFSRPVAAAGVTSPLVLPHQASSAGAEIPPFILFLNYCRRLLI